MFNLLRKQLRKIIFQKLTGIDLSEFEHFRHFRERFRTRVFMSSQILLPKPEIGKFSYGYDEANIMRNYRDFENIFRGDEEFIKQKLHAYDSFFQVDDYVLEIGCGRGEFLEILAQKGVKYIGVDMDESMVEHCLDKGLLPIIQEDYEIYLKQQSLPNFNAIFSAQFVEHIPSDKVLDFFKLCHSALKPGGMLIVETVNPYSIESFRAFHVDLTHQKILYPEVLLYCCMAAGFKKANIYYPNHGGFSESEYDVAGEYAVIAYS